MADQVGPLLIRAGLVTKDQLAGARKMAAARGGTVLEQLVAIGVLSDEQLSRFFRERLLVPWVSGEELARATPEALACVPADMAVEFRAIPLRVQPDQTLLVALADPSDTHAVDEIGFFTGRSIDRAAASPLAIAQALHRHYGVTTTLFAVGSGAVPPAPVTPVPLRRPPAQIVSTTPLAPAQIVDDVYGDDTPIPKPIPFDVTTGSIRLYEQDELTGPPARADAEDLTGPTARADAEDLTGPTARPDAQDLTGSAARPDAEDLTVTGPAARADAEDLTGPTARADAEDLTGPTARADAQDLAGPAADPAGDVADATQSMSLIAAPEADAALEVVLSALARATSRDETAEAAVEFFARLCRRAAFFVVRKGELSGWLGKGVGVHVAQLRRATLRLDRESTFRAIVATRLPYRGPVTDPRSRDFLIEALGWAPDDMLAIPITIRDKVIGLLYADERQHPLPDEHLHRVSRAAAEAFVRVLRRKVAAT